MTNGSVSGALPTCYPGLMAEKYPCQMRGAGSPEIQPRPRFPALDPALPRDLLPPRWTGSKAAELFADRRERWMGEARREWLRLNNS